MQTRETIEYHLPYFISSTEFYKHWALSEFKYTEGVKYLAEAAECYWLIDAIYSYQKDKRIILNKMLQEIQFWELNVDLNDNTAVLTCVEDAGREPIITQRIPYTDFPLPGIKLSYENDTLMLPSER